MLSTACRICYGVIAFADLRRKVFRSIEYADVSAFIFILSSTVEACFLESLYLRGIS